MAGNRIHLQLHPLHGGSFTRLSLSGPIATALPARDLKRLLAVLAFWSGTAVAVALDADAPVSWLEYWSDALTQVPERHFAVHFRRGHRGGLDE